MKAELLFAKLANLLEHHCAWSALLSMGNLDTLIEHCCLSPDSYEANDSDETFLGSLLLFFVA